LNLLAHPVHHLIGVGEEMNSRKLKSDRWGNFPRPEGDFDQDWPEETPDSSDNDEDLTAGAKELSSASMEAAGSGDSRREEVPDEMPDPGSAPADDNEGSPLLRETHSTDDRFRDDPWEE
jgi:hypothetical protein